MLSNAAQVPVLIDTDPGIDDAVALMVASAQPGLRLLSITTVAGNLGITTTTTNAQLLKTLLQLECPVAQGAALPLNGVLPRNAAHVHGNNGLGGWQLTAQVTKAPLAEVNAVTQLYEQLLQQKNTGRLATLITIGPLTNIAQLLQQHPDAAELIHELVVMGGGFGAHSGNITPRAEFNIYTDPEAAQLVFSSGIALRMVGLNVTEQATLGAVHLREVLALDTPLAAGLITMLGNYLDTPAQQGLTAQHDALAVAAVADPQLLEFTPATVEIVTALGADRGHTRVRLLPAGEKSHIQVATGVQVARFREFMAASLLRAAQKLLA